MGGSVKIAVRFKDGTVKAQSCWTNSLPGDVICPAFVAQDPAHLEDMISEGPYAGDETMAPSEYGIVVFDTVTDRILSMQEFSRMEDRTAHHIAAILNGHDADDGETAIHAAFAEQGRIKIATKAKGAKDWTFQPIASLEELRAALAEERLMATATRIHYDLNPWTFTHFAASKEGSAQMRAELERIGIAPRPEDEAAWEAWLADLAA